METKILVGDVLHHLTKLEANSFNCVITSPPYWGLRDYGVEGQLGVERDFEEYLVKMVNIFREVWRVLREDGTLWLNLGDSYNAYNGGAGRASKLSGNQTRARPRLASGYGLRSKSLKPKDLVGLPWRTAFALQEDGWYLRSDIIWSKPNPMPESARDRPTKAHEYLFLFSKSRKYYYDYKAIAEPGIAQLRDGFRGNSATYVHQTGPQNNSDVPKSKTANRVPSGWDTSRGGHRDLVGRYPQKVKERGHAREHEGFAARWDNMSKAEQCSSMRNKRSVWTIATHPFEGAHFATFPEKLVEPCLLAGCPKGGVVLDPFGGAGTVGLVAEKNLRNSCMIELNPAYAKIAKKRIEAAAPMLGSRVVLVT